MEAARAAGSALFGLTAHDVPDVKEEQDEERMAPPSVPSVSLNEDDPPPAFPAMNSAQRQAKPSLDVPASSGPSLQPQRGSNTSTAMGGLRAPLTTPPQKLNPPKPRKKVALAPGCSPLDWARLKSTTDLRGGVTTLLRITPTELKRHNKREDAWTALQGKVYNITPYMRFHPGGEDTLMRVAGRDGTRLFFLTHSWVNIEAIIGTTMVGILVSES
ncbi:cytochrome-b5 reductase [Malassezia japonica]|uniref:Cytochrome-b5 reductase n=1 Tax=Malassezia japonica TaxID=223818 RepID=A0AAF0J9B8_9BASI|nr:cytochrome-b5 reductase [Malassezia japonica]WFD38158.1 cytochrome-b5 reductase [Malassezia japonica]